MRNPDGFTIKNKNMNQRLFIIFFAIVFYSETIYAFEKEKNTDKTEVDTIQASSLSEVVITSSGKETNQMKTLPGSITVLSPAQVQGMQIFDVKDLSAIVPNFFIPDYGSKMTAPVYIRGIGNRSSGQAAGMYVDNIPYLNKTSFDFDFIDIQQIEVLRGPQGTLYGRNAMGGIINIFTPSALDCQYTKVGITGGNYGILKATLSDYSRINEDLGISIAGYYDQDDGYFTNEYSGKKADATTSYGGRLRLDFKVSGSFTGAVIFNYDKTEQGAFPYGKYDKTTGTVQPVNYNDEGNYNREMFGNTLNLAYKNDHIQLSSSTSIQTLKDQMNMDQDYSPLSMFTLTQKQKQYSFTEEITVKSNNKNNYQWSFGVFGLSNQLNTRADVDFKSDGIKYILQPVFTKLHEDNPRMPLLTITDPSILIPGLFDTPTLGGAVFHQSTYNNLFVEGLSLTAGIRLDYEKDDLDYNTSMTMDLAGTMGNRPVSMPLDTTLAGSESLHFTQLLPKVSLKYELNKQHYVYATVAKGYNPGGFNIQMFSDIVKEAIKEQRPGGNTVPSAPIKDLTSYKPEFSWNYEIGFKGELIKDILRAELSLFYIDVKDMQLTQFVKSGAGRMLTNAGSAVSKGVDFSLIARLLPELSLGINYGYSHATFKDYDDGKTDYSGKFLPFAPQQTFSVYGTFRKTFINKIIDRINVQAQYNGAGKIYWTPANDMAQDLYGILNLRAGGGKGIFNVSFWMKNALNTDYDAFYFESMDSPFVQKGKPMTLGADVSIVF